MLKKLIVWKEIVILTTILNIRILSIFILLNKVLSINRRNYTIFVTTREVARFSQVYKLISERKKFYRKSRPEQEAGVPGFNDDHGWPREIWRLVSDS